MNRSHGSSSISAYYGFGPSRPGSRAQLSVLVVWSNAKAVRGMKYILLPIRMGAGFNTPSRDTARGTGATSRRVYRV